MPPPSDLWTLPNTVSTWQCLSGRTQQQLYELLPVSSNRDLPYSIMSENRKNILSWGFPPLLDICKGERSVNVRKCTFRYVRSEIQIILWTQTDWSDFAALQKKPWVFGYPQTIQLRLIRLCRCTGWPKSFPDTHVQRHIFSGCGSNYFRKTRTPDLYKYNSINLFYCSICTICHYVLNHGFKNVIRLWLYSEKYVKHWLHISLLTTNENATLSFSLLRATSPHSTLIAAIVTLMKVYMKITLNFSTALEYRPIHLPTNFHLIWFNPF